MDGTMSTDDAGQPAADFHEELRRTIASQIEGIMQKMVIVDTRGERIICEGRVAVLRAAVSAGEQDEEADIDRILARLDVGIAKENEAMDALLARLRTTRIAA
jgi:hypothetical protein